jgi:aryl-alcohol dehydrogenase-like predicted oxidoreductase
VRVIERRPFGRTGHESSRVIFGAAALSRMSQDRADRLLPVLDEFGINHLDVAASYGDAELRLAPWLAGRRADFFLATKTGDRDGAGARESLERSLTRLGVDSVDLIQLHNLVEPDEWEAAMSAGGALEALLAARDEGLTRFVGVTGHGLRIAAMHLRSLERYDFDTVLFPLNHSLMQDPAYRRDVEALTDLCVSRDVAMQTIKSIARGRWPEGADGPRFSWYEPLREPQAIDLAVRFVLSGGPYFLNTSSDATLLRATLEAASRVRGAPGEDEIRSAELASGVTPLFDGGELERI